MYYPYSKMINVYVDELKGKTLTNVEVFQYQDNEDDHIKFTTSNNETYIMYHDQDCCESVTINDIAGDINDLIGSPILMSEKVTNEGRDEDGWDSFTWTFYRFATIKGYVTIRWFGSSNGYYSESVSFIKLKENA